MNQDIIKKRDNERQSIEEMEVYLLCSEVLEKTLLEVEKDL